MSTSIGRPVSPTFTTPVKSQVKVSPPVASEPSVQTPSPPLHTQESFSTARQSVVGKSTETVNPNQGGQQIKQGIDQVDGEQLMEQGQMLMESPILKQEFSDGASTVPKLPPPITPSPKVSSVTPKSGSTAITPDMLVQARQSLRPVSQHQVLNLGDVSTGSTTKESTVSRKLGKDVGGVPLDRGRLPGPDGSIDIVGHSSDGGMKIEGKNPQQLAKLLKDQFGLQKIKTINLVSCGSEQFKDAFRQALSDLGVEVSEVTAPKGSVAVDRASGQMLDEAVVGDLSKIGGHDGALGLTKLSVRRLDELSRKVAAAVTQETGKDTSPDLVKSIVDLHESLLLGYFDSQLDADKLGHYKKIAEKIKDSIDTDTLKIKQHINKVVNLGLDEHIEVNFQEIILGEEFSCHQFAYDKKSVGHYEPDWVAVIEKAQETGVKFAACFNSGGIAHSAFFNPEKQVWVHALAMEGEGTAIFTTKEIKGYAKVLVYDPTVPAGRIQFINDWPRETI